MQGDTLRILTSHDLPPIHHPRFLPLGQSLSTAKLTLLVLEYFKSPVFYAIMSRVAQDMRVGNNGIMSFKFILRLELLFPKTLTSLRGSEFQSTKYQQ